MEKSEAYKAQGSQALKWKRKKKDLGINGTATSGRAGV